MGEKTSIMGLLKHPMRIIANGVRHPDTVYRGKCGCGCEFEVGAQEVKHVPAGNTQLFFFHSCPQCQCPRVRLEPVPPPMDAPTYPEHKCFGENQVSRPELPCVR